MVGYIGIIFAWDSIEVKDIEEIIILSMNITTHSELVALRERER